MVTWGARRDPSDFAPKEPSADARRFRRNFGSAAIAHIILDDPAARVITVLLGASSLVTTCAGTFTSIFRAFEKLEFGAIVTIAERVVTVSVVVSLLFLGYGLYEVSLAFLGGSFVLFALSAAIGRRRFAWFERGVDRPAVVRALRLAAPFASFNAVGTFTYTTGLVLLTVLQGPEQAGVFTPGLS